MFCADSQSTGLYKSGWRAVLYTTVAVVFILGPCCLSTFGQTKKSSQAPSNVPTVEELQKAIAEIEQLKTLDADAKAPILDLYRDALEDLYLVETRETKIQEFEQDIESAADEIDKAKASLAEEAILLEEMPDDASLSKLEKELDKLEKKLEEINQAAAEAENEPIRRATRRQKVESLLKAAHKRLATLERQEKTTAADKSKGPADDARRARLLAALAAVRSEILGYDKELVAYEATTELWPLKRDLATRDLAAFKKAVAKLKKRVVEARRQEAKAQVDRAKLEAAMADPALQELAGINETLAEEYSELIEKNKKDNEMLSKTRSELSSITRDYEQDKSQQESMGREISFRLTIAKRILPPAQPYIDKIGGCYEEISETQPRIFELTDRLAELTTQEQELDAVMEGDEYESVSNEQYERDREEKEFLKTQKKYIHLLLQEYSERLNILLELNTEQEEMVNKINEYNNFIDSQILWIRSAKPLWEISNWPSTSGIAAFVKGNIFVAVAKSLWTDFREYPLVWIVAVLVLALLIYGHYDAKPVLRAIGDRAAATGMQRFWPTVQAVLLTALLAIPTLVALAFLAWRMMKAAADMSGVVEALAFGLMMTSWIFIPLEYFRQTCRARGLAECHFDWPATAVSRLHKTFSRLIVLVFPLLVVAIALGNMQDLLGDKNTRWENTFGRFCFIALFIVVAFFMHFLLRKRGEVYRGFFAHKPHWWLPRAFMGAYFFMVVFPLLLCLIAALGYYFTAWHLATCWLETVILALVLLVSIAFFLRWILIIRRRMAMERARLQREDAEKAQQLAIADPAADAEPPKPPAADIGPDLDTINLQARRIVYIVFSVIAVIALWMIWNDVLPAFGIFREVKLWPVERQTPAGVTISENITLADLSWALLILGVALVAVRNIPGLLEMSILSRLPIDKGLRFAITTVCRYLLVVVGVVWACNYIGLSWGKVQWILAAMSVGLGFGLQEIFANFASGMVILFERPVRIGDIITIGDATGKVLRIQMRATTILDWDKKELVVPNKEFATGRLLNWTLTDTLNRLVIDVGVSYKSDPEQVRELLLQIAAEHPKVAESPKPICIFREFGASSLNFSLRIYLASMKGRLDVIHEMHSAIHKRFHEAGIEIAYPQLDLHVRSGLRGSSRDAQSLGGEAIDVAPSDVPPAG